MVEAAEEMLDWEWEGAVAAAAERRGVLSLSAERVEARGVGMVLRLGLSTGFGKGIR